MGYNGGVGVRMAPTYRDYIRQISRLPPEEQLRLVEVITANLRKSVGGSTTTRSILELEGLGAEVWQGVDVAAYLRRERESWD